MAKRGIVRCLKYLWIPIYWFTAWINMISFWDALIVSAAESAKCSQLWTEDLNTGQIIRGIKVVNPLSI